MKELLEDVTAGPPTLNIDTNATITVKLEPEEIDIIKPSSREKRQRKAGNASQKVSRKKGQGRVKETCQPAERSVRTEGSPKLCKDIDIGGISAPLNVSVVNERKESKKIPRVTPVWPDKRVVELLNGEKKVLSELFYKIPYSGATTEFRNIGNGLFVCEQCNMEIKDGNQTDHHDEYHGLNLTFKCKCCDWSLDCRTKFSVLAVYRHIRAKHLKPDQYHQCSNCSQTFWKKGSCEKHEVKCTRGRRGKKGVCSQCGAHFESAEGLIVHEKWVHSNELFHCPECPKIFKNPLRLSRHREDVHRDPEKSTMVMCDKCPLGFRNTRYLNRHKLDVHPKQLFPCTFGGCDKVFKRKFTMEQHLNIHLNIKPLSCDYCEFACRQRNSMDVHMRTHHKDKYVERPKLKRWVKTS